MYSKKTKDETFRTDGGRPHRGFTSHARTYVHHLSFSDKLRASTRTHLPASRLNHRTAKNKIPTAKQPWLQDWKKTTTMNENRKNKWLHHGVEPWEGVWLYQPTISEGLNPCTMRAHTYTLAAEIPSQSWIENKSHVISTLLFIDSLLFCTSKSHSLNNQQLSPFFVNEE